MKTVSNTSFSSKEATHAEIAQMERDYVLHTWSVQQSDYHSPVVVGGEGATFWDMDGNRYLDFSSQAMCSNLGHQHPKVVEAIKKQADQMCFIQGAWASEPRARLAKKLAEITPPNLVKTFFANAGAEANENAIKIARFFTGKQKIITRYRSYHGASAGAMTLSADPRGWPVGPGIPGVVRALNCHCYHCSFGLKYPECGIRCAEHIEELIQYEGADNVAAVLLEPIVGSSGLFIPPDEYLPRVREICTANNVLLIFDEVMCGFGRTGKWFACQHWDVEPDMIVMAKGITGAMIPLGAVTVSKEIADYFENRPLVAGLTYSGHPLCCAAALGAISAYEEEGLIDHSREMGEILLERLHQMEEKHPCVGEARGKGLFATLELVRDKKTREPLVPYNQNSPALGRLLAKAKKRGVIFVARWDFFILAPPLVISRQELDFAMDLLDELLVDIDQEIQ
jgi:taurine--2-oxoglutarate transaminase